MVFDILSAQNAEEAMDLAFFGKDYEEPQSDNATRKGNPNFGYEKTPNINLQFNEVVGMSHKEALDTYYGALKETAHCEWIIPGDAAGVGAKPAPKYDDPATKDKIDKGYQLATEFITDYEAYLGVNVASLDKTKLEGTELAGLKNRGGVLSKKIYQNCQPDQDGFTEAVFIELKKLVKLLEEAHGTPTSNTKQELEQFIAESESNADKKQALSIAKTIKYQDSDKADCVATAREKLMIPQEKSLKAARQKLKSLLAGLRIDGQDAYEVMITNIKDSETALNKAIEIWQKCQEVDAATNDDKGELLNALNNLKNDTHNSAAWTTINKYRKGDQDEGYAEEMLKKLND
ncbi:18009_t:CDS:2 [Cetraspora pellucida]|uniref:18009_t:CDS:1 n=1 Tax=Cetraspora pellucida TaxID=1433469 RepID=A0ACA9MD34_9GLOM|nr:18009_t:CDS:2 [Cetraspora pellucida]